MSKKIIGVASNLEMWENTDKLTLNETYRKAIEKAGAIPLIIPMSKDEEDLRQILSICSGLLVPGGVDVSPLKFGKDPRPGMGVAKPNLDDFQIRLTQIALELELPYLGICRGEQVLNVALGGTLIQDLSEMKDVIKHKQEANKKYATHCVKANSESIVGKILGTSFQVNSFHHQAVEIPGKDLRITSRSSDGIAESIELTTKPFVVGIQWHPEAMLDENDEMLPLFKAFVDSCV